MKPHWILVANDTQARLLQQEPGAPMVPVQFSGCTGRLHFARDIAECLEAGACSDAYAWVSVYAPSPFLGELRQLFGPGTRRLLAGVHDVDLSTLAIAEIENRMRQEHRRAH